MLPYAAMRTILSRTKVFFLTKKPANTDVYGLSLSVIPLTLFSPSRARTYNNSVNSRVLCQRVRSHTENYYITF